MDLGPLTKSDSRYFLSTRNFSTLTRILVDKIQDVHKHRPFDVIVPIIRGGYDLGVMLSYFLELPRRYVHVSRYEGVVTIDKGSFQRDEWKNPLIVDDLTDQGQTLERCLDNYGPAWSAVLYHNKTSVVRPDFWAALKPKEWVVFPWETYDDRA